MVSWSYSDYVASIDRDVEFGVAKRGYTIDQAIGFAYVEIALRLEERLDESPLALATKLMNCGDLSVYRPEDDLVQDVQLAIDPAKIAVSGSMLFDEDKVMFLRDAGRVQAAISAMR